VLSRALLACPNQQTFRRTADAFSVGLNTLLYDAALIYLGQFKQTKRKFKPIYIFQAKFKGKRSQKHFH
jgi:hypothetical protein